MHQKYHKEDKSARGARHGRTGLGNAVRLITWAIRVNADLVVFLLSGCLRFRYKINAKGFQTHKLPASMVHRQVLVLVLETIALQSNHKAIRPS